MRRERILKVVMAVVGVLFVATVYPLVVFLWQQQSDIALQMMLSLYVTLGIFLLLAARNPSAHSSLIGFTVWSSFAHGAVMAIQSIHLPSERGHLLGGTVALFVIGVALLALAPGKTAVTSAASA
jgi:hypothetical protein